VSKIAENMVGGNLQPKLAEKLAAESRGNPLFVVESLRMLDERGSLVQEDNQWRLVIDELGIPSKIRDIILRRLAVLKYAQRRVLDAASVIGEKFDVELLSTVLGLDSLEVLETLNVIAHSTSLVSVEENFYRFDHARSRETLYEELSLPLKRGYHARIAEKLEDVKGEELPLSDLAYHYAQSGNKEKAIKYAIEAGKDALAKFSGSQAISHFTYVLQASGEKPQHAEQRAVALEGLGDAFYANNMFEEAVKTFESLANTNVGAVKLRALTKAMYAAFFQGGYPRIEELVRRAEEQGDMSRHERARVLHFKGVAASGLHKGNPKSWLKLYEEALQIFEEEYALSDSAWLLFVLADIMAYVASLVGEMEKPLAMCLRSIAIYDELADFRSQMEAYNQAASVFGAFDLYPEALGMTEKVFEIERRTKMGNYVMLAKSSAFAAQLAELMGDFAGAEAKGLKAIEYSEKSGSYLFLGITYSYLVINCVKLGNMSRADEYFAKLLNLPQLALMGIYTVFVVLAKAVYFAGKNQWEQSTKLFKELEVFYQTPNTASHIPFLENYAWALEKQGKKAEAKELLLSIDKIAADCAEKVKRANVQANLMVPINVKLGQTFNARLDMVNVSRARCSITNVQNLLPTEFKVTAYPTVCTIHDDILELSNNTLEPFTVKTVTLSLQSTKAGAFNLNPQVTYLDNLGQTKTCNPNPITVTVKPPAKKLRTAGKISSGTADFDRLLLGGIPEKYAIVLAAPSGDERSSLIERFLEEGTATDETTFYITAEAANAKKLATKHLSNFYLFLCNPQADIMTENASNVFKLKGVENLTDIDITLTKAFRALNPSAVAPRRICIDILSDVLLQHHAVTTRRWLGALLPTLKSKGFTILALIDPGMHPREETQAVLGLFDGEISIFEKETAQGTVGFLKIMKMTGQKYLKTEIRLTEE
jgi:tetratricopeptide (TPR) repeat protein/KaiC/GvpD/RAD55 family RecA-like ATPase